MYYLVEDPRTDPRSTDYAVFAYISGHGFWTHWRKSISEVFLLPIDRPIDNSPTYVHDLCKSQSYSIIATSPTPFSASTHPDLLL